MGNAARSSNLSNITLYDLGEVTTEKDYNNAKCIRSEHYKTSLLYGDKLLLFPDYLFKQIQIYTEHMRPLFINDENQPARDRFLFTTSRPNDPNGKMSSSVIASALPSAFNLGLADKPKRLYVLV